MRLSEERIHHLAGAILDALLDEEHVDLEISEEQFAALLEKTLTDLLRMEDQIDEEAVAWIHRHKSHLIDGTEEFEIELEKVKRTIAAEKGYVLY